MTLIEISNLSARLQDLSPYFYHHANYFDFNLLLRKILKTEALCACVVTMLVSKDLKRKRKVFWVEGFLLLCLGILLVYLTDVMFAFGEVKTMNDLFIIFDEINFVVESQLGKGSFISIFDGERVDTVFPDHKIVEDNYQVIMEEFLNLQESYTVPDMMKVEETQKHFSCSYFKDADGQSMKAYRCSVPSQWKALQLMMCNADVPKTASLMPKTMALIRSCGRVTAAQIGVLMPNTVLPWHRGFHKQHLRYHLGLSIPEPEKYFMRVIRNDYNRTKSYADTLRDTAQEDIIERHWKEGEGFVLDDMMLHMVENTGNHPRIVLILDIKRKLPFLSYVLDRIMMYAVQKHEIFPLFLANAEPHPILMKSDE